MNQYTAGAAFVRAVLGELLLAQKCACAGIFYEAAHRPKISTFAWLARWEAAESAKRTIAELGEANRA